MDYQALWTELTTDPVALGYLDPTNATNDLTNIGLLNDQTQTAERDTLTAAEIFEQTDVAEFQALTDNQKVFVRDVWGLGSDVRVAPGSKARALYLAVFGGGSNTIAALASYAQYTTSRANLLGFGRIYIHDIEIARERYG